MGASAGIIPDNAPKAKEDGGLCVREDADAGKTTQGDCTESKSLCCYYGIVLGWNPKENTDLIGYKIEADPTLNYRCVSETEYKGWEDTRVPLYMPSGMFGGEAEELKETFFPETTYVEVQNSIGGDAFAEGFSGYVDCNSAVTLGASVATL